MDPISNDERRVANLNQADFQPFVLEGRVHEGQSVLQVNEAAPLGTGFHIFKMAPGAVTSPHVHTTGEHFVVIDGDLVDHDGYEYKPGDIVYLKPGTVHNSSTRNGCTLVVYLDVAESCV